MHATPNVFRRKELAILDAESQRSLVNLLPEAFARQIQNLWTSEEFSFLLSVSEIALRRELRRRDKTPGPTDENLRLRFWYEFNRVQDEDQQRPKMDMHSILGREVAKETFYKYYITDPYKLAWLLCPPADYKILCEQALTLAIHKCIEILETPHVNEQTGFIHEDLIDRIIKVTTLLSHKVHGIQKVGRPKIRSKADEEEAGVEEVPLEELSAEARLALIEEELAEARSDKRVMPEGDGAP